MKRVSTSHAILLFLCAITCAAKADTPNPDKPFNPYLETDADGIPLVVTHPELAPMSQQEKDARKEQAAKAEANKDWLLRIYEQRMQARAAAHPSDGSDQSLLTNLGSNADLARLAGVGNISNTQTKPDAVSAQVDLSAPRGMSTKPDAANPQSNPLSHTYNFRPLIAPALPVTPYGIHDFYAPAPGSASLMGPKTPAAEKSKLNSSDNPTDIQTPGMIAAADAGVPDLGSPDLTLDLLPGESIDQARMAKANANALALPVALPADQMHGADANTNSASAIPVAKIAPNEPDSNAPIPVERTPIVTPVHPPLRDPMDLLER